MSNVSVVVPLYNEEENISILQRELNEALTGLDYEIIFVDDGSSDETVSRIVPDQRIRVLRFEKNVGQSAAIFAGLQAVRSELSSGPSWSAASRSLMVCREGLSSRESQSNSGLAG